MKKMVDLNKGELEILSEFLKRNLKNFKLANKEKNFWNDVYNIDELEDILHKINHAKVHL